MKNVIILLATVGILILPGYAAAQGQGVDPLNDVCEKYKSLPPDKKPAACQDKELHGKNPLYGPDGILTKVVNIVSILTGIAAVIVIIIAGMKFIASGNSSQDVAQARDWAIYALIGLVVAALAQVLVRMVLFKVGVV